MLHQVFTGDCFDRTKRRQGLRELSGVMQPVRSVALSILNDMCVNYGHSVSALFSVDFVGWAKRLAVEHPALAAEWARLADLIKVPVSIRYPGDLADRFIPGRK